MSTDCDRRAPRIYDDTSLVNFYCTKKINLKEKKKSVSKAKLPTLESPQKYKKYFLLYSFENYLAQHRHSDLLKFYVERCWDTHCHLVVRLWNFLSGLESRHHGECGVNFSVVLPPRVQNVI